MGDWGWDKDEDKCRAGWDKGWDKCRAGWETGDGTRMKMSVGQGGIRDGCTRTGVGVEWVMMERHT